LIDDFGSFANFNSGAVSFLTRIWVFANKDLTQPKIMMDPASPAGSLTMPQSRRTFERFWTSIAPRPQPEILRDYLLGILTNTPPPSAASIVQVGPDVQISFTTSNGGSYRLEQADGLIPPVWTPLSGDFSGTGGTNQIFLPLDPTVLNRSYRIRSLP